MSKSEKEKLLIQANTGFGYRLKSMGIPILSYTVIVDPPTKQELLNCYYDIIETCIEKVKKLNEELK